MTGIVALLLSVPASYVHTAAEEPRVVYRERGFGLQCVPIIRQTSVFVFDIVRHGVFAVDTATWTAMKIADIRGNAPYEYSTLLRRADGGVACLQRGFGGTRGFQIDTSLRATPDTLPMHLAGGSYSLGPALAGAAATRLTLRLNGKYYEFYTFDGCATWILKPNELVSDQGNYFNTFFAVKPGSRYRWMLRAETNGIFVRTPMETNWYTAPHTMTLLHRDTVIWIKGYYRDTLCTGALGDTTESSSSISFVASDGHMVSINRYCHLFGTRSGRVFMRDSSWVMHEYRAGRWHITDTILRSRWGDMEPVYTSDQWYYHTQLDSSRQAFIVLHTIDSLEQEVRMMDYPALANHRFYPAINETLIPVTINNIVGPLVVTNRAGRGIALGSTLRDIDELEAVPVLFGTVRHAAEQPLVVSWYDYLVRVEKGGVGRLLSPTTRGESIAGFLEIAPYDLTTLGLRTPSVGTDEILFPGTRLLRFDREGKFLGILDKNPSTCALRLDGGRILIGNGTVVRFWQDGAAVDSVDVRSLLTTSDSISSGYISSMIAVGDSGVIAFVSGMRMLDAESQESRPSSCGGIVRSTNSGRTWSAVYAPQNVPYFLGTLTGSGSALIASYSVLVRDTTRIVVDVFRNSDESLCTMMEDRIIMRSSDAGLTWQEVYHTPTSQNFRLVGGNGIGLADGRLLVNTVDDILESTDNGLTWDFHDAGFREQTRTISLFTDDKGTNIYYCTETGLFKSETLTSVDEARELPAARGAHQARTWHQHIQGWAATDSHCTALINLMGERMLMAPTQEPAPGLYVAEIIDGRGAVARVPIMVIGGD